VLGGVPEPSVLPALQQVLATERSHPSLFTTVCTVQIGDGRAAFRLAGHPAPILLLPWPAPLPATVGLPLGLADDAKWELAEVALPDQWAVMLYTDGLIEGHGTHPPERLWDAGLLELLEAEQGTSLVHLPGRLVERAEVLNGGPLPDDVAILLLTGHTERGEEG
jgi:serine phosphatase RsbU (regulator of sigma subunit)